MWQRQNSDRDLYRERDVFVERDLYVERDVHRERDVYREPDLHRERDLPREHEFLTASVDYGFRGRDDSRGGAIQLEKDRPYYSENYETIDSNVPSAPMYSVDVQEQNKVYVPLSSRQRVLRDDKPQRPASNGFVKDDMLKLDRSSGIYRRPAHRDDFISGTGQYRQKEVDVELAHSESGHDGHINAILEVRPQNSCVCM